MLRAGHDFRSEITETEACVLSQLPIISGLIIVLIRPGLHNRTAGKALTLSKEQCFQKS